MPPISPERWRVLSPYLDEALDLAPHQRPDWLASVSLRDANLAADLQKLLAEQDAVRHEGFLDGAVLDPQAAVAPSLAGQILGAYRLLSPIGQGGTGGVWLAERCDGRFRGRAAVKLLNLSLIGRSGEERFRREGTILARLRHPHIAHLIDAGVSPAGQPFLVLEYVDGTTIDRHCDERMLGVQDRIRLFLDVLEAVAHAHASLIVHRDIKPANVLVSSDGQVKLLDFGIAALIEGSRRDVAGLSDSSIAAVDVTRALTPEYAAPEQLSGGEVTTATDVYALGVLLYVLLSGEHPAGAAITSHDSLLRAILVSDPPRVSHALGRDDTDALARHATRCGTTERALRRSLRGDLDAIVAKALKKNASERYASVTAFADDLRRYWRREPISARRHSLPYRTSRFVRRHAAGVGTGILGVLLLVALTAVHTFRLSTERDHAQREREKAVKVSELLMGVLTSADPYAGGGFSGEPAVRTLLDTSAEQVQKELAGVPELQAEMLTMMGRTYRRLALFDKSQRLLEQALASARSLYGSDHVQIARTLHELGVVCGDRGDHAGAKRHLEEAMAMRRRLLNDHPDLAVTVSELARLYQDEGANASAEPLHREALRIRAAVLGEDHRETAVSQSDLASVLRLNGDLRSAEALLHQSLTTNRRTRGEEHPNTAASIHDLALIAIARGDAHAAESELRRALRMQRKALGPDHHVLATTLNSLARALVALDRRDEAASVLAEGLDIARKGLGTEHQLAAIYSLNLASIQLARGQSVEAEALSREGLRVRMLASQLVPSRRRTLAEDDWSIGAARSLHGASLLALRRFDEAETALLRASRELESASPVRLFEIDVTRQRLLTLYEALGRHESAAVYRRLVTASRHAQR